MPSRRTMGKTRTTDSGGWIERFSGWANFVEEPRGMFWMQKQRKGSFRSSTCTAAYFAFIALFRTVVACRQFDISKFMDMSTS